MSFGVGTGNYPHEALTELHNRCDQQERDITMLKSVIAGMGDTIRNQQNQLISLRQGLGMNPFDGMP